MAYPLWVCPERSSKIRLTTANNVQSMRYNQRNSPSIVSHWNLLTKLPNCLRISHLLCKSDLHIHWNKPEWKCSNKNRISDASSSISSSLYQPVVMYYSVIGIFRQKFEAKSLWIASKFEFFIHQRIAMDLTINSMAIKCQIKSDERQSNQNSCALLFICIFKKTGVIRKEKHQKCTSIKHAYGMNWASRELSFVLCKR